MQMAETMERQARLLQPIPIRREHPTDAVVDSWDGKSPPGSSSSVEARLQNRRRASRMDWFDCSMAWATLGNRTNLAVAQATGSARTAAVALRFAENTAPVIRQVRASGVTSLLGIACILNARGVRTVREDTRATTQADAVLQRVAVYD